MCITDGKPPAATYRTRTPPRWLLQGRREGTRHMSMPNSFLSAWARALCSCTPMTCDYLRRRLPGGIVRSCRTSCCSPNAGHWQPCPGWRPSPSMPRRSGLVLTCGRACGQRLHLTLFGGALRVQHVYTYKSCVVRATCCPRVAHAHALACHKRAVCQGWGCYLCIGFMHDQQARS